MNPNSMLAVQLSPSSKEGKLIFCGRYPDEIEAYLIIHSFCKSVMMFKVKTTAPDFYCVRPNKGIMKPGDSITIEIKIRPLPQYKLLEVLKHYFKIQCVRAPAYMESFAHGWNESPGNKIVQTHYKCFFKIDEAPFGIRRILFEAIEADLKQNTESSICSDTSTETEILDTNGAQEEEYDLPTENIVELNYLEADDTDIGDSMEDGTENPPEENNTKQTAEQDISEHESAEGPAHFDQMPASAPKKSCLAITLLMFAFAILLLAFIIMHFDSIVKYLRSIQFFGVQKPDGMIKKFFKLRLFKQ